jgi:PhnB protein
MIDVNAYIFFNGNCAEAMHFYEKALGGTLRLVTARDMPNSGVPDDQLDAIMHARLDLKDGGAFMASDWMAPEMPYPGMAGFRVCLTYPKKDDAKRVFDALADGGTVHMPFEKTFWSEGFGMVADRFGTPWMVGTEGPQM